VTKIFPSTEGAIVVESADSRDVCEIAVTEFAAVHRDARIPIAAALHFD
jgi:hypothetical protein